MAHVVITTSADADLAEIIEDLASKGAIAAAVRYAEEFEALFDRLRDFPGIGAPRPKLGPQTRIGIIPPYLAIYDHQAETVRAPRILHGRRKIAARLIRRA